MFSILQMPDADLVNLDLTSVKFNEIVCIALLFRNYNVIICINA